MNTSLTYSLTFEEYHLGARLARISLTGKSAQAHHRAFAQIGFLILLVALLLMLACYFFAGLRFDRSQEIMFGVAALLTGLFYLPFMERQWDRRIYKESKFGELIELSLTDEHMGFTLQDATEIRVPWSQFSYIENEDFMVLIATTKWVIIPKHLVAGQALDRVRAIVPLSKGNPTC